MMQQTVYDMLPVGAEHPLKAAELCHILGITRQKLSAIVRTERRAGKPICASTQPPCGYYRPANEDELKTFCRRLNHRAGEISATSAACLKVLEGGEYIYG